MERPCSQVDCGYLAFDRVGDRFDSYFLDKALSTYMATSPVVLYNHDKGKPPIGRRSKRGSTATVGRS